MADAARSILFLSHSASRNGASLLLLHTLQWMRANTPHRLEVFCQGGGPLVEAYRCVARTHVAPAAAWPREGDPSGRAALRERVAAPLLRAMLSDRRPDLVYANTSAAWSQVAALAMPGVPLLWHVHELPYALALTLPGERGRALLAGATRVVAVSEAVREALVADIGVPRTSIDVVNGCVPPPSFGEDERPARRAAVRARLGWPDDAFVVGACGGPGWRKGSDLFLLAARRALDAEAEATGAARPWRFLWVGGEPGSIEALQFAHDARALGLEASCRRVDSTPDVDDAYAAMDVFALTSREDPFPLVMLEAAGHALPTLCFAGAGGGEEFAGRDAGIVVPFADVDAMARAFRALAADEPRRRALGAGAATRVARRHRLGTQAPLLLRSLERCLEPAATPAARVAWR